MARAKKVDSDAALMSAMMLFWRAGYSTTGTRQIEEETGITRFTLQTGYHGKKALFLKALDQYLDMFETMMFVPLQAGTLAALAQWFADGVVPVTMREPARHGCLMINSMTEFGRTDADVTIRVERFYTMVRHALNNTLIAAQSKGDISPDFDIPTATELLLANLIAFNVGAASGADAARTDALCRAAAAMVQSWAWDGQSS